ncbi:IS66 family insertion sequence element accessory protein TnpB [Bradyrhizobium sp. WSM471]|uniref:IS66 family insertion sequence element accessory protein TnpB n=1 Tax=Bradyrhizobium sp. WSM471 TaxID=319017 RepID=UPI00404B29A5
MDFRCGHDGLAARAQEMLCLDPLRGAAFVFRSKRADRIKILVWDRTGLVLVHKRLEGCKFVWPNDRRRRDAHIASGVRSPVRSPVRRAGLEVSPPGRRAASPGGWITAAD